MPCTMRFLRVISFYHQSTRRSFISCPRAVVGPNLTAVVSRLNSLLAMRYSYGGYDNKISPHSYMRLCGKDGVGIEPTTVILYHWAIHLPACWPYRSYIHIFIQIARPSQQLTAWTRCHWPTMLSCIARQDSFNTANTVPHPGCRYSGCLDRKHWWGIPYLPDLYDLSALFTGLSAMNLTHSTERNRIIPK